MAPRSDSPRPSETVVETVALALYSRGPLTRGEIATTTGLSRPSVSGAVAELLARGRAEEAERDDDGSLGRGRPSQRLRLSRRRADVIGLEIGRAHVAVAIADAAHDVVAGATRDCDPASGLVERAERAMELATATAAEQGIDLAAVRRIAVGTPGPRLGDASHPAVDFSLARLERERSLVAEAVSRRFGTPVDVGNNTRFTALGEAQRRHGAERADLVYLRVDEGVGGGIVQGGEIASGSWGAAGEIGHVSIDADGERCPCGGRGCLELIAAMPAIVRAAGALDAGDLEAHADSHEAARAILLAASATGRVVAGVLALVNPSALVIGGRAAALPGFVDEVERVARDTAPTWATLDLVVEAARTDHLLGALGAAAAAAAAAGTATALVPRDATSPVRKEHRA